MLSDLPKSTTQAETPDAVSHEDLLIACLCAEWCTACRAYRTVFDAVAAEHPDLRFLWVDIEASAALLDQIEVENFPTILIGGDESPCFFGTITPQREVLVRLIASHRRLCESGETVAMQIRDLLGRLRGIAG